MEFQQRTQNNNELVEDISIIEESVAANRMQILVDHSIDEEIGEETGETGNGRPQFLQNSAPLKAFRSPKGIDVFGHLPQ